MNIIDAIKTGKRIHRDYGKNFEPFWIMPTDEQLYNTADILADWIVEAEPEKTISISYSQLAKVLEKILPIRVRPFGISKKLMDDRVQKIKYVAEKLGFK